MSTDGRTDGRTQNYSPLLLTSGDKNKSRIQFMLAVIISKEKFYQSQHNCDVVNYINEVNIYVDFVASN